MSKQKNIEDADVVVDFRGGKDAAAKYRQRIKQLKAELDELKAEKGMVDMGFVSKGAAAEIERLQTDNQRLEGIIVRFKAGCKITGKGPVDKNCEMVQQLKAELDEARRNNYSGCVHTIATSVDREGCCVSCGEDLNYLAIMQIEKEELRQDLQEYGRHAAGCSAAFGDYSCTCGWDRVKESDE